MRSSTLAYVAALLACAAPPHAPTGAGSEEPPRLQLPAGVRPLRYALGLEIVPSRPGFAGTVEIDIELDAARDAVWLNGRGLRVSDAAVTVGGERLPVRYEEVGEEGVARVSFPRRVGPGRATLRFAWTASWGKGLAGLYLAKGARGLHAVSQLQDVHARTVFPCFDEPRFKTPFDLTVTVPAGAAAVSNGPIAAEEAVTGGLRRLRFAPTAPLPTYLVFVGVGPFEVVTPPALPSNDVRAMPLSLRAFTEAGHGAEAGFPLEATRAFVPWYERYFAIPFPYAKLDEIAVPEFAWCGMENAGAIGFRDSATSRWRRSCKTAGRRRSRPSS